MGQAKQQMIEDESRGYSLPDPDKKHVCASHFKDKYLQQYIRDNSVPGICEYCGHKTQVIDLHDFMEYAAGKITAHYTNPDGEPLYLGSSFYDDGDEEIPGIKRVGPFISPSFAEHFESTLKLLYELDLITDNDLLNRDIENCFNWDEWIQRDPYLMTEGQELFFLWEMFGRMVKHEQRFTFFKRPEFKGEKLSDDNNLMDILSELGIKISEHKLCKEIDVATELYRCRFINAKEKIGSFEFKDITSAPDDKAKQSRMSPAGISMFYGAFDQNTAIVESSSKGVVEEGDKYFVGKFKTKKKLTVLDLTNLPELSFWMPSDWQGISFLHSFSREITKSIERDDRIHIEYVPSQVFTEYLRLIYKTADEKKIDGIIYKSSLKRATGNNIVLFYNQYSSADILELISI